MQKLLRFGIHLLAAGSFCASGVLAQQTPAASTTQSSSGQSSASQTPAKKPAAAGVKKATPQTAKTAAPVVLKTDKDKESYAWGMNLGTGLHRHHMTLDPALVARGIKDAMNGGKTALTEDEARAAMHQLDTELRNRQAAEAQAAGTENRKAGEAFLASNKSKSGVVTQPDGLQYKILKAGDGPKPTASDSVKCNYRGTLIDGKEFDSSYKRGQPAVFPVGGVIKGWTEALQLMPVGSKWQLFIPADLAYGDAPPGGSEIKPGDTLIFEIELLSIESSK